MLAIIAFVVLAIAALTVLSLAAHVLFSPWLLLAAVGIVVWIKFRPRRSGRGERTRG
jgi:predicted membrane metal-binding protein